MTIQNAVPTTKYPVPTISRWLDGRDIAATDALKIVAISRNLCDDGDEGRRMAFAVASTYLRKAGIAEPKLSQWQQAMQDIWKDSNKGASLGLPDLEAILGIKLPLDDPTAEAVKDDSNNELVAALEAVPDLEVTVSEAKERNTVTVFEAESVTEAASAAESAPITISDTPNVTVLEGVTETVTETVTEKKCPGGVKNAVCYDVTMLRSSSTNIENNNNNTPIYRVAENALRNVTRNILSYADYEAVWDRAVVIPVEAWPDVNIRMEGRGADRHEVRTPKQTLDNCGVICAAYGIGFRFDTDTWMMEMTIDGSVVDLDCISLDDVSVRLHSIMVRHGITVNKGMVADWMAAIAKTNMVSPFRDTVVYKYTREGGEGTPYLDAWVNSVPLAEDEDMERARTYLRNFVVGKVKTLQDRSYMWQYALVLTGAQGAGKTSKIRELMTGSWDGKAKWHISEGSFNPSNKEDVLRLCTRQSIELAEVANFHKQDQDAFKRLISSNDITMTLKYANFSISPRKQAALVITGNFEAFMNDSSGARRYLPIRLRKVEDVAALYKYDIPDFDIGKVWADAVWLAAQGYDPIYKDTAESVAAKTRNNRIDNLDIVLQDTFVFTAEKADWRYISYAEIYRHLEENPLNSKVTPHRLLASIRNIMGDPNISAKVVRQGSVTQRMLLMPPTPIMQEIDQMTIAEKVS
jgi:hypothetical protein